MPLQPTHGWGLQAGKCLPVSVQGFHVNVTVEVISLKDAFVRIGKRGLTFPQAGRDAAMGGLGGIIPNRSLGRNT